MSCLVTGCLKRVLAKDLCSKHYWRMRRSGNSELRNQPTDRLCSCGAASVAKGLCRRCYDARRASRAQSPYCTTTGEPTEAPLGYSVVMVCGNRRCTQDWHRVVVRNGETVSATLEERDGAIRALLLRSF